MSDVSESRRLPPLSLVSCWRCSGHLLVEPGIVAGLRSAGAGTYCDRCRKIVEAEEAARPCVPGMRCVHVQYQHGPFSELVVRQVRDGMVTVSLLGHPQEDRDLAARFWPPSMAGRREFSRGELIMKGM